MTEQDPANELAGGRGTDAAAQLAADNIALAYYWAKRYWRPSLGMSLDELVSDACFAMLRAAHEYDPARGAKFGTYASTFIKWALGRAVHNARKWGRMAALDPEYQCPDAEAHDRQEAEDAAAIIARVKAMLKPRWFAALEAYHVEQLTFRETGRRLGCTHERARQIILKAERVARKFLERQQLQGRYAHVN